MPYNETAALLLSPFTLGIISALAVIVPGIILLFLIRGVNQAVLKNLTIMLAAFGITHGLYHLLLLFRLPSIADPIDLVSVILLVLFGIYYTVKVG
ncbi:MAG: hypothetical protein HY619_06605 [Thaumarchaeota archaeon]|nr:hypothetical protein [Nitrososphaerota archaeon]